MTNPFTAMNGGEMNFRLYDEQTEEYVNLRPDGYVKVNGEHYFFEYDGCYFHHCPYDDCIITDYRLSDRKDDTQRNRVYEQHGTFIQIQACRWHQLSRLVTFKNFTSCFYRSPKLIPEEDIWDKIKSKEFFGIIKCNVRSPPEVQKLWGSINFPPIFNHLKIDEKMIGPSMLEELKKKKVKLPLEKQLTLVFNAEQYMMTTELAAFYLEIGCELSNLTWAIEYQKDRPLKPFVDKVTASRVQATLDGDDVGQMTYKLVANRYIKLHSPFFQMI